jgi:hypothetical protein
MEIVRPCVRVEEKVSHFPLPLQVILRGTQSIVSKLADGADLEVVHAETVFEARTVSRKLLLEYNRETRMLRIMFEKYLKDGFFTKCAFIECNAEIAKDILHYVRVMLCDAIDTLTIRVPDSLLLLFTPKSEEAKAQTA